MQSSQSASQPLPPAVGSQPSDPLSAATTSAVALSTDFFDEMMRRIDRRFDEIGTRFDDVDSRLSGLPAMQAQIDDHAARIVELERQNLTLSEGVRSLQSAVALLQRSQVAGAQELRQASAHLCEAELIISGVPCASADGTSAAVLLVAVALGVALVEGDILSSRYLVSRSRARLSRKDAPLPILVRLRSRDLCLRLVNAKKSKGVLRTSDLVPQPAGPSGTIYVNEALPGGVYKLLVATRTAAKARGFKYIWHSAGAVLVKFGDGERTRRIRSLEDLEAFEVEFPPVTPSDAARPEASGVGPVSSRGLGRGRRGASAAWSRGGSRGALNGAAGASRRASPTVSPSESRSASVTLPPSLQQ